MGINLGACAISNITHIKGDRIGLDEFLDANDSKFDKFSKLKGTIKEISNETFDDNFELYRISSELGESTLLVTVDQGLAVAGKFGLRYPEELKDIKVSAFYKVRN